MAQVSAERHHLVSCLFCSQAHNVCDERLVIGAVGWDVRHAFVLCVHTRLLQKFRNLLCRELRMRQVWRVIGALTILAVAVITFVRLEPCFALCH